MPILSSNDPTQRPSLHNDEQTFDDPIRKVGHDATSTFDNSASNPTECAGSEALHAGTSDEETLSTRKQDTKSGVHGDAIDTGIDDADLRAVDDDEESVDEEDDDEDDEDLDDEVDDWDKPEEEDDWDPDFEEFDLPKSKGKKVGGGSSGSSTGTGKKGKGGDDDDDLGLDDEFKDLDLFNDRGFDDDEEDF